jgi:hypothetical protein
MKLMRSSKDIERTYEALSCESSAAQVLPRVVMATPAMLTKTATTFDTFIVSWPINTPMKRVNSPEVDDKTVVLATLVRASAAFDRYCKQQIK